jgi:hypothetical protein
MAAEAASFQGAMPAADPIRSSIPFNMEGSNRFFQGVGCQPPERISMVAHGSS